MSALYELGIHRRRDARDEVWHRAETAQYFDGNEVVTPEQAVVRVGADVMEYVVSESATMNFKDDYKIDIPGTKGIAIFNAPWSTEPVPMSRTVKNRYVPFQNMELANVLDNLAKEWPLEGFMILKEGEIVVFQLKIGEYFVGNKDNERTLSYLTLANDHTNGGLMWLKTHIRTVCWNTYNASLGDEENRIRIIHSKNADTIVRALAGIEELAVSQQKDEEQILNDLFTRKVDNAEVNTFLVNVFPEPGKTTIQTVSDMADKANATNLADGFFDLANADTKNTEWKGTRAEKLRTEVAQAYIGFGQEFDYAENTGYALWNATTQVISHSKSFTGSAEKNYVSQLNGVKATTLNKAWDQSLVLTGREPKYFKKKDK